MEKNEDKKTADVSKSTVQRLVMPWYSVEDQLPDAGEMVIATYRNELGKTRMIMAHRLPQMFAECQCECECDCEYSERMDESYYPEGWYEQVDNWDDFACVRVYCGEVTHRMHLPVSVQA